MIKKRIPLLLIFLLTNFISINGVYGKGLKVSPSSYTWNNVVVGTEVKCPVNILIKNESKDTKSYTLRAVMTNELNADIDDGFKELPSKRWISFDRKRLAVGPGESKPVEMSIEIPEQQKYLNKKWCFFIEVKEYTSGSTVFALACYPKFYVVTGKHIIEK